VGQIQLAPSSLRTVAGVSAADGGKIDLHTLASRRPLARIYPPGISVLYLTDPGGSDGKRLYVCRDALLLKLRPAYDHLEYQSLPENSLSILASDIAVGIIRIELLRAGTLRPRWTIASA